MKSGMVDVPLAMAEGFRNTPKLYGGMVSEHRPITDWKSGVIVSGTNFVQGIGEGVTDIFVEPVKGFRQEGAIGAGKGFAKGIAQVITKPSSGKLD
jgi:hypothetical protein